ncbi:MAG TPA: Xaa-Pro aminopeptidase [Planctomycetaceae bacterium]|nr:Xaa-Pro aminopeptidase [Planctomycetaceae bacterium]
MRPFKITALLVAAVLATSASAVGEDPGFPAVLNVRQRAETIARITKKRLDTVLPMAMRRAGFDMWIIVSREDNYDPVFNTMIPDNAWCPITQILVFHDPGPGKQIERMNISRTKMDELHASTWDYRAWDNEKRESQWDCLARIVKERDPRKIGINESDVIWAADGLTASLKTKLLSVIGPEYAARCSSAEPMASLWLQTLLPEDVELYERAVAISHAIIAETMSRKVITPGVTTTDDLVYHYAQRASDLGLPRAPWNWFAVKGRTAEMIERYGKNDKVIRPGDLIQCDVGLVYLRYWTDHCEWGYVLKPGETDAPEGFKKLMAEGNRLQDIFRGEFQTGRTGNEMLAAILKKAKEQGIGKPKIYSHSIGYYAHEPGPLVGLPWEQANTGKRGDVRLVPNSTLTAELSVAGPVPELGGQELNMALEQIMLFTEEGTRFLDGRQTRFHLVK